MKVVGVVAAVVLAHENVSPWQVAWWALIGILLLAGALLIASHVRAWSETKQWPRSTATLVLIAAGIGLYVWGLVAGYTSLPLIG